MRNKMAKMMKLITVISFLISVICLPVCSMNGAWLSTAITFVTITYHFAMRLAVGKVIDMIFHNRIDYNKRWFEVGNRELRFYDLLRVKKWKSKMPTYDMSAFDPVTHTWDEIAQATCQSELVHEIIIVFSFLPIIAAIWLGALPVFVITSVFSACFDWLFVIMQRYNRPRILKVIKRQRRKAQVVREQ